jgi:hypothetical protein
LTNLPGIVGCICGDDRRTILNAGNHGHLPVQPCRQGGDRSDRPEHSTCSRSPCYSRHSRSIPAFCRDVLRIRRTVREINLSDLVAGSGAGRGRSPGTLPSRRVQGGTGVPLIWCRSSPEHRVRYSRGQGVRDTAEQAAGVTPGSADVRLRWRKIVPDNLPETIVDFPENHDPEFYLKDPIILGPPPILHS